jgi:hypothetical protein
LKLVIYNIFSKSVNKKTSYSDYLLIKGAYLD